MVDGAGPEAADAHAPVVHRMRQGVAVLDADEPARIFLKPRTPRKDHLKERLQVREVSTAVGGRVAFLHVDVEVVVAVPGNEPVVLEPRSLESGGNAVRVRHRAEAVHAVVEDALDLRVRHFYARALGPELRPVRARRRGNGVERMDLSELLVYSAPRLDRHGAVLRAPGEPHPIVGGELPPKAAESVLRVEHTRLLEAERLQLFVVDGEVRRGNRLGRIVDPLRKLHREDTATRLRHRDIDAVRRTGGGKVDPRRSGERIELAASQRGAGDFQDDAPERQHVGVARLAFRRLLLEERHEPLGVAAFDGGDDVGVALGGGPLVSAAVIPEIVLVYCDFQSLFAPYEGAEISVGERHSAVRSFERKVQNKSAYIRHI